MYIQDHSKFEHSKKLKECKLVQWTSGPYRSEFMHEEQVDILSPSKNIIKLKVQLIFLQILRHLPVLKPCG